MPAPQSSSLPVGATVLVAMVDLLKEHRLWGWLRIAQGANSLAGVQGLRFAKVMGSGHAGGFSLRPSASHQGLVCVFDSLADAQAFCDGSVFAQYRSRARELCFGLFGIQSSRGAWDGVSWTPQATDPEGEQPQGGLVAAITRASILPTKAPAFWRMAPAAQAQLPQAEGCLVAMGLGEAPLLRQCTFSIWRNTEAMDAYARSGAHSKAIAATYRNGFFSESMFVRMRVLFFEGIWEGKALDFGLDSPAHMAAA